MAATLGVAACTDYESSTNLKPEGPAMVHQVRIRETYTLTGSTNTSTRRVFGFGTHPQVLTAEEAHPVTTASAVGNSLRIIMDELLVGNNLEEIACRAPVNANGSYSRLPLRATPNDVAGCAAAQDVLPRTCAGEHAVCLCEIPAGCAVGTETIAMGAPVGVLDINQDGAADDTRFIEGAVGIQCGAINVPIDLDMSYWNPSGNQQVPAMGGFEALGPALVVVPRAGLPTNIECGLTFGADVVDKQGDGVCAPPNGDVDAGCEAGDLSAFKFSVEKLTITGGSFASGAMGVSINTDPLFIVSAAPAMASLNATNITISPTPPGATPLFTIEMNTRIKIDFQSPLLPGTTYTITFTTGVTDSFGRGLAEPVVFTFTTAP